MTQRALVLSLGFLGISCSSATGDFVTPPDAAVTDVSQDVPSDVAPRDVPPPPDAAAVDVIARDVPAVDAVSLDVPAADVPSVDAPPADLPAVDAPPATCTATLAPPDAVCGASVCGNNRIDTCRACTPCGDALRPAPDAGTPPPPFDAGACCADTAERCDGAELNATTCASLGYSGGALRCGSTCAFDTSDCEVCATGPAIVQCGRARVSANAPRELALAAADARVGLAWVSDPAPDGSGGSLGFAALSSALAVTRSNPCLRAGVTRVALSATARGWLLAAQTPRGVDIMALDADGALSGAARTVASAQAPLLSSSPDGRALLVYTVYGAAGASVAGVVLNADGSAASPAATLLGDVTEPEYGSAVATGDGWLVAERERGVAVVRVGADGRVGTVAHPTSNETEYPQIGWNGTFATLTWSDFGASPGALRYGRLDAAGNLVGSALTLGTIPTYYNVSPTAAVGADTAVLLGGYTGGTGRSRSLAVQRVSAAGVASGAPIALTAGPDTFVNYRIAALGTDVVAAWLAADSVPGRITVARIHP